MSYAVLWPNSTKKFQWEVFQIAEKKLSIAMLLGGSSVNLNHLKMTSNILNIKHINVHHYVVSP